MKLNKDCVRDVLLFLETQPFFQSAGLGRVTAEAVELADVERALPQYPVNELYYVLRVLSDGDYINSKSACNADNAVSLCVELITYRGHEFLDSIRDERQWAAVKKGLSAVRNYSLSAIQSVAAASAMLKINFMSEPPFVWLPYGYIINHDFCNCQLQIFLFIFFVFSHNYGNRNLCIICGGGSNGHRRPSFCPGGR